MQIPSRSFARVRLDIASWLWERFGNGDEENYWNFCSLFGVYKCWYDPELEYYQAHHKEED